MEYIFCGIFGIVITYFLMVATLAHGIKDKSKRNIGVKTGGKVYFFMTQDQIQKAVRAVIKTKENHLIRRMIDLKKHVSGPDSIFLQSSKIDNYVNYTDVCKILENMFDEENSTVIGGAAFKTDQDLL